jgi:DNA polymerase-3 subunit epsilon
MLIAGAETVLPGDGPLFGAAPEETSLLARWLSGPGIRLGRASVPWAEPAGSAGAWRAWAERAAGATF